MGPADLEHCGPDLELGESDLELGAEDLGLGEADLELGKPSKKNTGNSLVFYQTGGRGGTPQRWATVPLHLGSEIITKF